MQKEFLERALAGQALSGSLNSWRLSSLRPTCTFVDRKVLNLSAAVTSHITLRSAVLESKASPKPGI
jgi:hypothetical protein